MEMVEQQRIKGDFIYMMLYSANDDHARAHYHRELAKALLNYLHIRPDDPHDQIAECMRKVAGLDPTTPPQFATEEFTDSPKLNEYIHHMIHDCCCATLTFMGTMSDAQPVIRKCAQDGLLFMNLHLNPPFLQWLMESDPSIRATDVQVHNKQWLQIFSKKDIRESLQQLVNSVMTLETVVAYLRGAYITCVGTVNPGAYEEDGDSMVPDIPSDFCIDV